MYECALCLLLCQGTEQARQAATLGSEAQAQEGQAVWPTSCSSWYAVSLLYTNPVLRAWVKQQFLFASVLRIIIPSSPLPCIHFYLTSQVPCLLGY